MDDNELTRYVVIDQEAAVEAGLEGKVDWVDLGLIDYVRRWAWGPKALRQNEHVWIDFQHALRRLRFSGIQSRSGLSDRFHKLIELGIFTAEYDERGRMYLKITQQMWSIFEETGGAVRPSEQAVRPSERIHSHNAVEEITGVGQGEEVSGAKLAEARLLLMAAIGKAGVKAAFTPDPYQWRKFHDWIEHNGWKVFEQAIKNLEIIAEDRDLSGITSMAAAIKSLDGLIDLNTAKLHFWRKRGNDKEFYTLEEIMALNSAGKIGAGDFEKTQDGRFRLLKKVNGK